MVSYTRWTGLRVVTLSCWDMVLVVDEDMPQGQQEALRQVEDPYPIHPRQRNTEDYSSEAEADQQRSPVAMPDVEDNAELEMQC